MSGARDTERDAAGAAGQPRRVAAALADLLDQPAGRRNRQLLHGAAVTLETEHDRWGRVRAAQDGYQGYLPLSALGGALKPSHKVAVRATHLYAEPDIKSADLMTLSYGALLTQTGETGRFFETPGGYALRQHLEPADTLAPDPVAVARLFLGTPYLWGGNSSFGIDCSGLVQAALLAAGIACPGDSSVQEAQVGADLTPEAPLEAGDLLFWKGHVAIATGPERMIHANGFHMAVVEEPIQPAIERIMAAGDGPVTRRARPSRPRG